MLYYINLIIIFSAINFVANSWFKKVENKRIRELEENDSMGTVRPKAFKVRGFFKSKEDAVENIGSRFSIIRGLFFSITVFIFAFLFLYPLLPKTSKNAFSLIVSASTVLIGIAARPIIENIIAGIVITFSKQLNIGDTVLINDKYGMVEDITMNHSIIKIWDSRRYVVPNSEMLREKFINYTLVNSNQWATVEFFISPKEDFKLIKEISLEIAQNSLYRVKESSKPYFWIMDINEKSVKCWITAIADSPGNGWNFKTDTKTKLLIKFNELGIKTHTNFVNEEIYKKEVIFSETA